MLVIHVGVGVGDRDLDRGCWHLRHLHRDVKRERSMLIISTEFDASFFGPASVSNSVFSTMIRVMIVIVALTLDLTVAVVVVIAGTLTLVKAVLETLGMTVGIARTNFIRVRRLPTLHRVCARLPSTRDIRRVRPAGPKL